MSIKVASSSRECQDQRLKIKTLGEQMKQAAVQGAGMSPWEAEVLVEEVERVYFSDPALKEAADGQLKYCCVAATEGPGKPLTACEKVTVILTLVDKEDRKQLSPKGKIASIQRRRRKIMRMSEEAREQGGLLTQEDLAEILSADVRTIRRDITDLREADGIYVATRGQVQDIGPGVSHRGIAVRLWLEGKEPPAVAKAIKHSIAAVENYLEKFKRVAYLDEKDFSVFDIALTVGMSVAAARTYVDICHSMRSEPFFAQRLAEIELVGEQHYLAADEKKDSASSSASKRSTTPR